MDRNDLSERIETCPDLKTLFALWEQAHKADPLCACNTQSKGAKMAPKESFIEDGNGANYWRASPRVLFVLREAHAYGADQSVHADYGEWLEEGRFTQWFMDGDKNIDRMEGLSLRTFRKYRQDAGKIASLIDDRLTLDDVAYMNLDKRGGFENTKHAILRKYVNNYRDFIRREIAILDPDWIVCCGTFGHVLDVLDIDDMGEGAVPCRILENWGGKERKILNVYHLSAFGKYKNDFEKIGREISR